MACDAQTLEALAVLTNKYLALSDRDRLMCLANVYGVAAGLIAQHAVVLAKNQGLPRLSDRDLEAALLAVICGGGATPVTDPTVLNWVARIEGNGGVAPSNATIAAASTFMTAIGSLKSRIWHLNIIAPDSIIAMRTPLINIFGIDPWIPHTVGLGFSETVDATGWRGYANVLNGIVYDMGVDASIIPSFTVANGGISFYAPEAVLVSSITSGLVGSFSGAQEFSITPSQAGFTKLNCYTTGQVSVPNPCSGGGSSCGGFFSGNRTLANRSDLYYASSTNAWSSIGNSVAVNATLPSATKLAAGGVLHAPATFLISPQMLSFVAVHDGFSSADGQILFNAVQALRVALGGGFV